MEFYNIIEKLQCEDFYFANLTYSKGWNTLGPRTEAADAISFLIEQNKTKCIKSSLDHLGYSTVFIRGC